MSRYTSHDYEGYRFVFKFDEDAPDLLHIFARHRKTVHDAVEVWFEGTEIWHEQFRRYETYTDTTAIFWFWLEVDRTIMIISCFDR